jgi:regulator of sirC expression with transglutaminase-like and TPR domain
VPTADLALFAHVVSRPEDELDLAQAALLIAEPEYPGLDLPHYLDRLDRLAAAARERIASGQPDLTSIARFLHEELGFHGNAEDYYDPRNSYLNEVLDRRTGIPITLALVLLEVARRAGVTASGVSFPGHFLVRSGDTILDPFDGRPLDLEGLRELQARVTGQVGDPDPELLQPATKRQILSRMLNNLRGIWQSRGDTRRVREVVERLEVLQPTVATPPVRTLH